MNEKKMKATEVKWLAQVKFPKSKHIYDQVWLDCPLKVQVLKTWSPLRQYWGTRTFKRWNPVKTIKSGSLHSQKWINPRLTGVGCYTELAGPLPASWCLMIVFLECSNPRDTTHHATLSWSEQMLGAVLLSLWNYKLNKPLFFVKHPD